MINITHTTMIIPDIETNSCEEDQEKGMVVTEEVEYSCIRDKVMIGLGVFVFLCILCSILLFTIHSNSTTIGNNGLGNHSLGNETFVKPYNATDIPSITGLYGINGSMIYFTGYSKITFIETVRAEVLIVGGGGGASYGGGWLTGGSGTGGGGGGCVGEGILTFTAGTTYEIIVGSGGIAKRNKVSEKGRDSMITGKDIYERAGGGGFGGYYFDNSEGGGSYGYNGNYTSGGTIYTFDNTFLGTSVQGSGRLTYHSHSGGGTMNNDKNNPGSGGGGGGGPGNLPILQKGGLGGDCYVWKVNNECYGKGGNGGSMGLPDEVDPTPLPNTGGGGNGGSTSGGSSSSSGSSGIVIIKMI